jgi:hypothetical protein
MAIIAVDIDSTLYDFETPSRDACLKLWQKTDDDAYKEAAYHPWTEWRSPADVLGVEKWLTAIAVVHESDSILRMDPFPGAVETCQSLIAAGHNLIYITNRAAHTEQATYEWLDGNGFLDDTERTSLVVTEGDKRPFIADAQYIIDDRLKTCVQFAYDYDWHAEHPDLTRLAFVKAYPYNQNATDIPNLILAPTWAAINVYLVKKGLLPEVAVLA